MTSMARKTVPFDLGRPLEDDVNQIKALKKTQRDQFRDTLDQRMKFVFPIGPYPCKWQGTGWCQLTFAKDSAVLKYVIFGPHWGLDVKVDSLKENGMVDVIGVSEYFDAVAGRMKIQELGWRAQVSGKGPQLKTQLYC